VTRIGGEDFDSLDKTGRKYIDLTSRAEKKKIKDRQEKVFTKATKNGTRACLGLSRRMRREEEDHGLGGLMAKKRKLAKEELQKPVKKGKGSLQEGGGKKGNKT